MAILCVLSCLLFAYSFFYYFRWRHTLPTIKILRSFCVNALTKNGKSGFSAVYLKARSIKIKQEELGLPLVYFKFKLTSDTVN